MLQLILLSERAEEIPGVLSGGMKQRVALARALMTGSKLILLDEPLGALDAKIRLNIRKELVNMVKSLGDLTVIHVTQDVEEALMVSDYITVLFFGQILQVGTPEELFMHPNSIQVCNFLSYSNFFEGVVVDLKDTYTIIDVQGTSVRVEDRSYPKGSEIAIAVRASNLKIQRQVDKGPNQFEGKILRRQFIHGFMRYEVELAKEKTVVVLQKYETYSHFEEEEKVIVSFLPEHTLLFNNPGKEELEKLLEK
jgi:ABC-type Fe3+/spermidine/putrescine transport system ATPase subunit